LHKDELIKNRKQSFLAGEDIGMVGLSQMKSSDSNAQVTQTRPLTSAKMTTVNYKDARNARK